jgi:hypothetical protein
MKNTLVKYLKISLFVILTASAVWLSSCSDKDEPVDTSAPEVSFADLTANKAVWNIVPIKVAATDNAGITKVEVFVDGNLIKTITATPYETNWDSNTIADGSHTVKVIVTDAAGNKSEEEVIIVVKNVLVTLDFKDNQLDDFEGDKERGFIFLSDESGKLIVSAEYTNGQHLELKSPAFNGENFYLTEALYDEMVWEDGLHYSTRLWSFSNLDRNSKWVVLDDREGDDNETYAGEAELNFTNLAASAYYGAFSNGDGAGIYEMNTSATLRLRKSPSKLYVVRNNDGGTPAPTYGLFSNIVTGANSNINLNSVNQALTKVIAAVPIEGADAEVDITAFPVAGNYDEPYYLGYFTSHGEDVVVYHPGAAFPTYYVENYFNTDDISYSRASTSEFGNFSIPAHNVVFSFANNELTYTATGNFDFVTATFYSEGEKNYAYWRLLLPLGSNLSVPVLELPAVLTSFNVPVMGTPFMHGIDDLEAITNYDELKNFISNSDYSVDELFEYGKNYVEVDFYSSSSSGRKKTQDINFRMGTNGKRRVK